MFPRSPNVEQIIAVWQFILSSFFILRGSEREREGVQRERGGAEREGDTESEAGSRLRAVSAQPDAGLEPANREVVT